MDTGQASAVQRSHLGGLQGWRGPLCLVAGTQCHQELFESPGIEREPGQADESPCQCERMGVGCRNVCWWCWSGDEDVVQLKLEDEEWTWCWCPAGGWDG